MVCPVVKEPDAEHQRTAWLYDPFIYDEPKTIVLSHVRCTITAYSGESVLESCNLMVLSRPV